MLPAQRKSSVAEQTLPRHPITDKLIKVAKTQSAKAKRLDMAGFTYDKQKSQYKDAKADISIYDEGGTLVFLAREFGNNTIFWEPTST